MKEGALVSPKGSHWAGPEKYKSTVCPSGPSKRAHWSFEPAVPGTDHLRIWWKQSYGIHGTSRAERLTTSVCDRRTTPQPFLYPERHHQPVAGRRHAPWAEIVKLPTRYMHFLIFCALLSLCMSLKRYFFFFKINKLWNGTSFYGSLVRRKASSPGNKKQTRATLRSRAQGSNSITVAESHTMRAIYSAQITRPSPIPWWCTVHARDALVASKYERGQTVRIDSRVYTVVQTTFVVNISKLYPRTAHKDSNPPWMGCLIPPEISPPVSKTSSLISFLRFPRPNQPIVVVESSPALE